MENMEEKEATFLTEKDIEQVINSLSDDVVYDTLKEQIDSVFSVNNDKPTYYLSYFTTKYDYILSQYSEYEDVVEKIKDIRENLFFSVKSMIEEKFDFSVEFPESMSVDQQLDTIGSIYKFFIIRYQENSLFATIKYIERETKDLLKHYKPLINKNDLSYTNVKKDVSKDAAVLICKLPEIIDAMQIDGPDDLLELAIDDQWEISNTVISELFSADQGYGSFGPTFVDKFIQPVKSEEYYYLMARNYLLEKYNPKGN
jgi:hypothetical protein